MNIHSHHSHVNLKVFNIYPHSFTSSRYFDSALERELHQHITSQINKREVRKTK